MQRSSSRLNDTPRGSVKSNYARCMVENRDSLNFAYASSSF